MVRLAQVREWFGPVPKLDVGADLVQGVISSFSTFNALVEFRECCFEACMIEVPAMMCTASGYLFCSLLMLLLAVLALASASGGM